MSPLRRCATLALCSSVLMLCPPRARPQAADITNIPLEDLAQIQVYSASRFLQKTIDAPASITIVTADDIRYFGYRTLADIVANVRDFYVADDRNYAYVGVRGFARPGDYNTRLLLLVDGHRINDPVYDQGEFDRRLPVDLDLIDRVEIVRGPTSSLYGTNAMLAVVNVITTRGATLNGVQVTTTVGGFGSYGGRLSFGRHFPNRTDLLLSVSAENSNGDQELYFPEFDAPATHYGVAVGLDGERARSAYLSLARPAFTLRAGFGTRFKLVPTASYAVDFNRRESTSDTTGYIDLSFDRTLERWEFHAHAAYDIYSYDGVYPVAGGSPELDHARARWWTADAMVSPKLGRRQKLQFGGEFRYATQRSQFTSLVNMPGTPLSDPLGWSAFVEHELTLHRRLKLVAGVRYDDTGGPVTANPRFAVVFKARETTALKFLASRAFRAPNAYEQSYYPLQATLPRLKPEKIQAFEFILEHYAGKDVRLSFSAYRNSFEDLITETGSAIDLGFINFNDIDSSGISAEIEKRFQGGAYVRGSWTAQRTTDPATRHIMSNSPIHVVKFAVMVPLLRNRLNIGITERATSGVENLRGLRVPAYTVTDLTLTSARFWRATDVSASVYNVFNNRVLVPGAEEHTQQAIPQYGRSWRIKVTHTF